MVDRPWFIDPFERLFCLIAGPTTICFLPGLGIEPIAPYMGEI